MSSTSTLKGVNHLRTFLKRVGGLVARHKVHLAVGGGVLGAATAAMEGMASATAYTPTSDITTMANSAGSSAGPIVAILFAGIIGLLLVFWAFSWIVGLFKGRHAKL
jgi:hypothetical protein